METIFTIFAPFILLVSGVFGLQSQAVPVVDTAPQVAQTSVEFELYEVSPKGREGGFAIPASGCSAADPNWHGLPVTECSVKPTITVNDPIIPYGQPVVVSWDPKTHTGCVLSANLNSLSVTTTGSATTTPTGETSYSITCDSIPGETNAASVTVKVLPRIQET